MSATNNGGPAFPTDTFGLDADMIREMTGMSLRDYFAAHAPEVPDMQTFPIKQWTEPKIVDLGGGMKGPRTVIVQESWAARSARWALEYADAMLAERTKP